MNEVLSGLSGGFGVALMPLNLFLVLIGCFAGTLIGALPGIGPINGVAILLPIAYSLGLPPESALILLAGIYYGAEYGGRISSILLNVPGDAGAVMTTLDGNPMAKRGEAGRALSISAIASFVGGTIAVILMSLFGPFLAKFALTFTPADYVALMVFAFASLSSLVGKNQVKTLMGAAIGLMLATVGIDANTGVARYTGGIPDILAGFDFLVVVIGFFGMAELIHLVEQQISGKLKLLPIGKSFVSWKDLMQIRWTMLRSSIIGFVIGVLPGVGASVASAVTYGTEMRMAGEDRKKFGTGDPRGLAAPESGNNAAAGGAMVPMLTLGIPGSGTTAILLGALMLFNVTPGPLMFEQRPEIAWGLIASMYIGNLALLVINLPLVGLFARMLTIPQKYLSPLIAVLAFIGVYSVVGNPFDLFLIIAFGIFGWVLRKLEFSLAPIILGFVLGHLFEDNLRRALSISRGDWSILVSTWESIGLYVMAVLIVALPVIIGIRNRRKAK
ncbi:MULTISPECIES: tripartite tricarboxylate transporter permease [Thalassospira]|jgi:putative tricarboxylic transport membrane protein|uniref:Tripartite tricarboxylate transporter TctA n=1 Tax=Thalassospira profundimaris TaxID=502049 RepID=A0A367VK07_9PROT|nr:MULTISPECIES: tripartite tricarboxylate transporter permease [Thalassospira]MBR9899447.1 tripartite tricarboxylate transporter permease [Rhodospirillales bacterium]KZB70841.1 tripartite tricarboxylate transporter TctA [Thalassospira sp. MCCC 1A01148]MBO6805814.1 tripartite tricarboxylate transporter permease [Thalassospira sp.]MBO6841428.1 tripartite tricarboxylate transporter permease [Thalassospira sp.]MBS8273536.1 tripartite tricarboxylate transporter permease [Thalassospira tepidiphila]|tara:strand:- start:3507 stop:5009 length:1503 start_codon:yes stop_codon:yes gene_type:complete